MACCYLAASVIAFIIRSCDALDVNLNLQYNESLKHMDEDTDHLRVGDGQHKADELGVTVVSVAGMTCAACTSTVEAALKNVAGVNHALVSLPFQEARVLHDPKVDKKTIVSAVANAGYRAVLGERSGAQKVQTLQHGQELAMLRTSLKGLTALSTIIFMLGTALEYAGPGWLLRADIIRPGRPSLLFCLTVIAAVRYSTWIFADAATAARAGRVSMHTLIAASTFVGMGLTLINIYQGLPRLDAMYHDTIVGVLLIVSVGRYMDLLSRRKATDTFAGLYRLLDRTSCVKLAKLNKIVPTSIVRSGDEIIIDAFDIVPCDAYVVSGMSVVHESVITGEPIPKTKTEGDLLLAGSRNGPGRLYARVNQDVEGSFLSQLVRSVENSLSNKVSVQHRIDVVTQYFVSTIFAIAIPTAVYTFWSATCGGSHVDQSRLEALDAAGKKLMTILAAACPCALGLATPCAVMAGIDVAWRRGILMLEGGETMERLRNITHIVMDKTGTLTRGTLTVSDLIIESRWKCDIGKLATLICGAEEHGMAAHPLAMAIFQKLLPVSGHLWRDYQDLGGARELIEKAGRGVICEVNAGDGFWRTVAIGNLAWMRDSNIKGFGEYAVETEKEGSEVFVGIDGEVAASMVLQDAVRPDARNTIDLLKSIGFECSMLTGDQPGEASRISRMLGIEVLDSAATPDVKLKHIRCIQDGGGKVLMVGDGMNDGPSLATADVGVMMSNGRKCLTSGGSVLLLQPQLESIIILLEISRATMEQVSRNIQWVIAYNLAAVALAIGAGEPIGIRISPPIAATMMSVSSLIVTAQGILLRSKLAQKGKTKSNTARAKTR